MEFRFVPPELRSLDDLGGELIVCAIFEDERPPLGLFELVDWRLSGSVSRLVATGFFRGKRGETLMLPLRPRLPFDKGVFVGLGMRAAFDDAAMRAAVEHIFALARGLGVRSAVVELPGAFAGELSPETRADIVTTCGGEDAEIWTLVERFDDQKRIVARMAEQRRRVPR